MIGREKPGPTKLETLLLSLGATNAIPKEARLHAALPKGYSGQTVSMMRHVDAFQVKVAEAAQQPSKPPVVSPTPPVAVKSPGASPKMLRKPS